MPSARALGFLGLVFALSLALPGVLADCECGYSVNSTPASKFEVFTDVLESDFTTLDNISKDTDWVIQHWSVEPEDSKGPYGRQTDPKNVVSNPLKKGSATIGINGGEPGLELWVRAVNKSDKYVSVAEADTARTDMQYGTFRVGMRTTSINGTCGAFFWYLNDTQEIDMEFLSAQMNETTSPVNLVLHSVLSKKSGGDATFTPTYKIFPLPFRPSDAIHEYRFDWNPGSVSFYADGEWLLEMDEEEYIPRAPGKIVLSHWSNGQALWSAGPPEVDAKLLVSYVKAYFNSTDKDRKKDHVKRCQDRSARNAICRIQDQKGPPKVGEIYFFSQDPSGNKVDNQSIYGTRRRNSTSRTSKAVLLRVLSTVAAASLWIVFHQ